MKQVLIIGVLSDTQGILKNIAIESLEFMNSLLVLKSVN